jgi:HAD superfamily hydrolase (TIGR01458 family)
MDKGFILDLEGTLISSGKPLPGAVEFIEFLNKNGCKYSIITNTVSKTIEDWESILNVIGFSINKEKIIYPINALNEYIIENNIKSHYFIGHDNIKNLVQKTIDFDIPEYVIFCDFERINVNYELFNKIFKYIMNGSKIITTSYSNYYISGNEYKVDTGIFVKMYEILTNKDAIIIGKPSKIIYEIASQKLELENNSVIVIGDDGLTDIIGGKEMKMETILVKTGKYKIGDEGKYKPDRIVDNLLELIKK